jgi:hypothetical protein
MLAHKLDFRVLYFYWSILFFRIFASVEIDC